MSNTMDEHFIKFKDENIREMVRIVLYTISLLGIVGIFLLLLFQ